MKKALIVVLTGALSTQVLLPVNPRQLKKTQFTQALAAIKAHDVSALETLLKNDPLLTEMKDDKGKTLMHHAGASVSPLDSKRIASRFLSFFTRFSAFPFFSTLLLYNVSGMRNKLLSLGALFAIYQAAHSKITDYFDQDMTVQEAPAYPVIIDRIAAHASDSNAMENIDYEDKTPIEYVLYSHSLDTLSSLIVQKKGGTLIHPLLQPLSFHFTQQGNQPVEKARIIFLGESHENLENHLLNYKALETLAKPGDVVLVEGIDFTSGQVPVSENLAERLLEIVKPSLNQKDLLTSAVDQSSFPHKVSMYGWEKENNIPHFVKAAFTIPSILTALCISSKKCVATAAVAGGLLAYLGAKIEVTENIADILIPFVGSSRDSGMIDAIEEIDSILPQTNSIFVIAGAGHLENSSYNQSFQEYLKDKKYTILVPKLLT